MQRFAIYEDGPDFVWGGDGVQMVDGPYATEAEALAALDARGGVIEGQWGSRGVGWYEEKEDEL